MVASPLLQCFSVALSAYLLVSDDPPPATLTPQVLGENALLSRALAECCGAIARGLGPRMAATGRLMRCVLLPLLERLADPCPLAAQAAGVALGAVCTHCGCVCVCACACVCTCAFGCGCGCECGCGSVNNCSEVQVCWMFLLLLRLSMI
jgi:hypothetical protein